MILKREESKIFMARTDEEERGEDGKKRLHGERKREKLQIRECKDWELKNGRRKEASCRL